MRQVVAVTACLPVEPAGGTAAEPGDPDPADGGGGTEVGGALVSTGDLLRRGVEEVRRDLLGATTPREIVPVLAELTARHR